MTTFSRTLGGWATALGLLFVAGALLRSRAEPTSSAAPSESDPALGMPLGEWTALYEDASLAEIEAELEALRRYLFEETNAYYEARFLAGDYELVPPNPDGKYSLEIDDDLSAWRYLPSREVARVRLPHEGFENAYEARLRTEFLLDLANEREEFEGRLAGAK